MYKLLEKFLGPMSLAIRVIVTFWICVFTLCMFACVSCHIHFYRHQFYKKQDTPKIQPAIDSGSQK